MLRLKEFPNSFLTPFEITSPINNNYNCVAWVLGKNNIWIEPDDYTHWYQNLPDDYTLSTIQLFFEKEGFSKCENADFEENYQKIAIFSSDNVEFMHVALQLDKNYWTSKLGFSQDVKHTLFAMESGLYGNVCLFMKK